MTSPLAPSSDGLVTADEVLPAFDLDRLLQPRGDASNTSAEIEGPLSVAAAVPGLLSGRFRRRLLPLTGRVYRDLDLFGYLQSEVGSLRFEVQFGRAPRLESRSRAHPPRNCNWLEQRPLEAKPA